MCVKFFFLSMSYRGGAFDGGLLLKHSALNAHQNAKRFFKKTKTYKMAVSKLEQSGMSWRFHGSNSQKITVQNAILETQKCKKQLFVQAFLTRTIITISNN